MSELQLQLLQLQSKPQSKPQFLQLQSEPAPAPKKLRTATNTNSPNNTLFATTTSTTVKTYIQLENLQKSEIDLEGQIRRDKSILADSKLHNDIFLNSLTMEVHRLHQNYIATKQVYETILARLQDLQNRRDRALEDIEAKKCKLQHIRSMIPILSTLHDDSVPAESRRSMIPILQQLQDDTANSNLTPSPAPSSQFHVNVNVNPILASVVPLQMQFDQLHAQSPMKLQFPNAVSSLNTAGPLGTLGLPMLMVVPQSSACMSIEFVRRRVEYPDWTSCMVRNRTAIITTLRVLKNLGFEQHPYFLAHWKTPPEGYTLAQWVKRYGKKPNLKVSRNHDTVSQIRDRLADYLGFVEPERLREARKAADWSHSSAL